MKSKALLFALFALMTANILSGQGALQLGAPFGENMVVQQGVPIPFWGTGCPGGDYVKVLFNGQYRNAHCDYMGRWYVEFAPMKAGGPFQLLMEIGGQGPLVPNPAANTRGVELNDVLIGELVLAPLQTGPTLSSAPNGAAEVAAAKYPFVRMYRGSAVASDAPGQWSVVSPNNAGGYNAAAYFLARELYNKLKVPIGVVDRSQGILCTPLQKDAAPQLCSAGAGAPVPAGTAGDAARPTRSGVSNPMGILPFAQPESTDAAPGFTPVASLRRYWNAKSGFQFFV